MHNPSIISKVQFLEIMASLDGILEDDSCDSCGRSFNVCCSCFGARNKKRRYIHIPNACVSYHYDTAKTAMQFRDLELTRHIAEATIGGGVLAVRAGRLAVVGKVGTLTSKALGGAMAGLGVITGVIDIVEAVNEKPPPLPLCTRCGKPEMEQPGCTLVCMNCGVECTSWRDGTKSKHCAKVCDACWNLSKCMQCGTAPAIRWVHNNACKVRVHRSLETKLYGTNKEGRILGGALGVAGAAAFFVPGVGWVVGAALAAGGVAANIAASANADPVVKINCGECGDESEDHEIFLQGGCEDWCRTCSAPWSSISRSKCCMALCSTCEQDDIDIV